MLWTILLASAAATVSVFMLVLSLECLAARSAAATTGAAHSSGPGVAVLIPAHNAAATIQKTLRHASLQLGGGDRMIVIAHNCVDETAALARAAGAEVHEIRAEYGKGHALAAGASLLERDPRPVVVVLDADTYVERDAIPALAREVYRSGRPVQGAYELTPPVTGDAAASLSWLAFHLRNVVRPAGLLALGLPCQLTGSGMAFPWDAFRTVSLATGKSAQDLRLGADLALAGFAPTFCPEARILGSGVSPGPRRTRQQQRWIHGHLRIVGTRVPRLVAAAVRQGEPELLGMALDLAVPPGSLLIAVWGLTLLATSLAGGGGLSWWPATVLGLAGFLLLTALLTAWWRYGRKVVAPETLLRAPLYALRRLPLAFGFLIERRDFWSTGDATRPDATPDIEGGSA